VDDHRHVDRGQQLPRNIGFTIIDFQKEYDELPATLWPGNPLFRALLG